MQYELDVIGTNLCRCAQSSIYTFTHRVFPVVYYVCTFVTLIDLICRIVKLWTVNTLNDYIVKNAKFSVFILCLPTGNCNHSFLYIADDVCVSCFLKCFRSFYMQ